MKSPSFFDQADVSILGASRQAELQRFAEDFVPKARALGYEYDDACSILYCVKKEHASHPVFQAAYEFLGRPGYGLDLLPLIAEDGVDLKLSLVNFYGIDIDEWSGDLQKAGLHGAHFRINLPNPRDRARAVLSLSHSSSVVDLDLVADRVNLASFSVFSVNSEDDAEWLADERKDGLELTHLKVAKALWMLDDESAWSIKPFLSLMKKLAKQIAEHQQGSAPASSAGYRYERYAAKVLPIINNMGYRMMAAGCAPTAVVAIFKEMIAETICSVVGKRDHAAFKRQALVNFLSAFPERLHSIGLEPGELHGRPKFKEACSDESLNRLSRVFAGPAGAFGKSCDGQAHKTLIAQYLMDHGYPFDLNWVGRMSSPYFISVTPQVLDGVDHPSKVIQEQGLDWLTGQGGYAIRLAIAHNWVGRLLTTQTFQHYSDVELLCVIESCIKHGIPAQIAHVFEARPHLKQPALEHLASEGKANPSFFGAFGFGREEFLVIGAKASGALTDKMISQDLGL